MSASSRAWIGARYAESRILILGESSWGIGDITDAEYVRHWLDHPNFTKLPGCEVCQRVGGPRYPRDYLNDALTTMMLGWPRSIADASRREAWAAVAFTNFILRPVETRSDVDRPTEKDWAQAAQAFPLLLAELKPRACLVLDNPSGRFLAGAKPALDAAGVKSVRLAHPTMVPAPTREARALAWRSMQP